MQRLKRTRHGPCPRRRWRPRAGCEPTIHCRSSTPPSHHPWPRPSTLLNPPKDLEYLNLALNNITRVEGLSRCESLARLDLTLNFIALPALPSVRALSENWALRELHLMGNPCAAWEGCRPYVIASLPQLAELVGAAFGGRREEQGPRAPKALA